MSDSLVIASKIKKHLKETHGMRSSEDTLTALTDIVIAKCAEAALKAQADKQDRPGQRLRTGRPCARECGPPSGVVDKCRWV